ncbi:MAG TPA: hypothetical protein VFP90_03825 [Gemmatimonadaceae bacterium]|nr:hypothetical protein [Gemmatimonadaceae bacterium]
MTRPLSTYRNTPLWGAVAAALAELQTTGEVKVETAPDYVIEFICRELVAKRLVTETALAAPPSDRAT